MCNVKLKIKFSRNFISVSSRSIQIFSFYLPIEKQILQTFPFLLIINHVYIHYSKSFITIPVSHTKQSTTPSNIHITVQSISHQPHILQKTLERQEGGKDSSLKIPNNKSLDTNRYDNSTDINFLSLNNMYFVVKGKINSLVCISFIFANPVFSFIFLRPLLEPRTFSSWSRIFSFRVSSIRQGEAWIPKIYSRIFACSSSETVLFRYFFPFFFFLFLSLAAFIYTMGNR